MTFQKTAKKKKKKFWWKNLKMKIILGVVGFVILTIIVVLILYGTGVFSGSGSSTPQTTIAPTPTNG